MDWDNVAPMIVAVVFLIATAGTILLYPLSRRLARLVEVIIQEKSRIPPQNEGRIEEMLVRMDARLERLEEEQRFLASLRSPAREAVPAPAADRAPKT